MYLYCYSTENNISLNIDNTIIESIYRKIQKHNSSDENTQIDYNINYNILKNLLHKKDNVDSLWDAYKKEYINERYIKQCKVCNRYYYEDYNFYNIDTTKKIMHESFCSFYNFYGNKACNSCILDSLIEQVVDENVYKDKKYKIACCGFEINKEFLLKIFENAHKIYSCLHYKDSKAIAEKLRKAKGILLNCAFNSINKFECLKCKTDITDMELINLKFKLCQKCNNYNCVRCKSFFGKKCDSHTSDKCLKGIKKLNKKCFIENMELTKSNIDKYRTVFSEFLKPNDKSNVTYKGDIVEPVLVGEFLYGAYHSSHAKYDDNSRKEPWNYIFWRPKKCPKCGDFVAKDRNCMHITCNHCGADWCWICKTLTKDENYFSEHIRSHKTVEEQESDYGSNVAAYYAYGDDKIIVYEVDLLPGDENFLKKLTKEEVESYFDKLVYRDGKDEKPSLDDSYYVLKDEYKNKKQEYICVVDENIVDIDEVDDEEYCCCSFCKVCYENF